MNSLRWTVACAMALTLTMSVQARADNSAKKVGVLFGSYGDVDDPSEVRELVLNTVQDPDVMPLPGFLRRIIAYLGWWQNKKDILSEYAAIGGRSNMRANSQAQADLVAQFLRSKGYDAIGYAGFAMTFPYIDEVLDQARADGVERLIVFYQGAQYSQVTGFIVFRDVEAYLDANPDWEVDVTAVKSFSDDERFTDLIIDRIDKRIAAAFPQADDAEVCIFLPAHGNIYHWIDRGDPSYDQMLSVFDRVAGAYPNQDVSFGFQNHDDKPFTTWTQPRVDDALDELATRDCPYVLINGMVSFTVGSLETLYDHGIAEVEYLHEQALSHGKDKEIVVEGVFDDDPEFANYMGQIALEAMSGLGDITPVGNGAIQSISLR